MAKKGAKKAAAGNFEEAKKAFKKAFKATEAKKAAATKAMKAKKAAAEKPLKAKKGAAFAKKAMKAMKAMRAKKAKKGGAEGGVEVDEVFTMFARPPECATASGQGFSPSRPPPAGREAFSPYSWASTLSPAYSYSSCFRHLSDDDDDEN